MTHRWGLYTAPQINPVLVRISFPSFFLAFSQTKHLQYSDGIPSQAPVPKYFIFIFKSPLSLTLLYTNTRILSSENLL